MDLNNKLPAIKSRTPNNEDRREATVRISLLSDSTSGIGDEDETSSNSVSGTDMEGNNLTLCDLKEIEVKKILRTKENKLKVDEVGIEIANVSNATIPDGGWGWMVVLSSFIISMIADGISFSFGLLYIEFLDEFQASKSTTAWIGSLFIAVPLLAGPIMSALVDRYGCRSMTILGGIVSTLGFVLASVSTTLEMMMVTFGVIAGLGLGLVYVTAVVSIAYWFEKKRNLAVGLGACGTGVGTFVYAPMTQYFIEEFGWRGTILLLSGTLLNLCVCGCVMRDPEWWILEQNKQNIKSKSNQISKNSSSASFRQSTSYIDQGERMKDLIDKGVSPDKVIEDEMSRIRRRENLLNYMEKFYKVRPRADSLPDLPSYLTYNDAVAQLRLKMCCNYSNHRFGEQAKYPLFGIDFKKIHRITLSDCEDNDPPVVTYPNRLLKRSHSEKYDVRKEKLLGDYQLKNPRGRVFKKSKSETKDTKELVKQDSKGDRRDWLKKQLSVNHHYLKDLKMPKNSISHRNAMLNIKRYRLKASSCPDIFKNSMITINEKEEKWYADCLSCLSDMFNVTLLKKPTFNLLSLGTIILFIWFIVPYFYLAEHMVQNGYTEDDGAVMLSLIGITNTIGMVGLGWIGDRPSVSIEQVYGCCLILCGAAVVAMPLVVFNYWFLASISCAFGVLFAASFTFTPSLLAELVSLDDFTSAYGLVLLAQGIGHLIGPPLSGLIYDVTQSWELSFYLAGGWIMVAGLLILSIHLVTIYQRYHPEPATMA